MSTSLFAQSTGYFQGKIINSTTLKAVPFATIKLKNNQLGVYANADGDFMVSANPAFKDDSLMITCIGYKQSKIAYKELSTKTVTKIYLTPIVYGLGEVVVVASKKKLNSITIIKKAIRNITINYPVKPFSYIAYYRDYQKKDGKYLNLNEALVQTLDGGFNTRSSSNKYRMLDYRKNTDFPRMNISSFYDLTESPQASNKNKVIPNATLGDQYGNELFVLMVHDPIRNFRTRSFSFIETFQEDFVFNHNFSSPATVLNNNTLLYKIDFTGKPGVTDENLEVSGSIYIQPNDLSIHKLEYTCSYKDKGYGLREMFSIVTEYGYENSARPLMYLKYVSFNNLFKVTDDSDASYFRVTDSYIDSTMNINPSLFLTFNNKIDPVSGSKKSNYEVMVGKRQVRIIGVQVVGKRLYIRLKKEDLENRVGSCRVNIADIKDINGNVLNKRKAIELYQFRELFVQEYNKSLQLTDSCYLQFSPLDQNCISKYSGNFNYWMNTPENIKTIK
jgi:hypothetical protein